MTVHVVYSREILIGLFLTEESAEKCKQRCLRDSPNIYGTSIFIDKRILHK